MTGRTTDNWGEKDHRDYRIPASGPRKRAAFDEGDEVTVREAPAAPTGRGAASARAGRRGGLARPATGGVAAVCLLVAGAVYLLWPASVHETYARFVGRVCDEHRDFDAGRLAEVAEWKALDQLCGQPERESEAAGEAPEAAD